ncbi:SRPBCC family protein [Mycolicibacterium sp. BiH015]|uniref:SRPBCC family protein n=1 Tax=Mycolicibacterium sp. BiH015 TaxID=3018808 RepID=UPI003FA561E9
MALRASRAVTIEIGERPPRGDARPNIPRRCMQRTRSHMVTIHVERTIGASPERVFSWLADPTNLVAAPLILTAGWAKTSSEPGVGALREATAVGMWLREEITAYDPPRSYSYRIVRSFPAFAHEGGTLTLTPSEDVTQVSWVTTYTHPVQSGGKALEAVTSRLFPWNFRAILDRCANALGS